MNEIEMNAKQLFAFLNNHSDEYFVRVFLTEEGDVSGETAECSFDSTCGESTDYEQY